MKTSSQQISLWHNRDYRLLWSGQLVSNLGGGITQIAFPLLILAVTHAPAQAALVSALRALTYVLFILPAGALLDRWERKRVMIICDIGRAVVLLCIPLALLVGQLSIGLICSVAFVSGALEVFFDMAELACLPQVVEKEQLSEALGRNQATMGLMGLISPIVGGALFTARITLPFIVDAITYFASVGSLILIRKPFQEQREIKSRHLRAEISEGLSWLWKQPLLRTMALITATNVFFGAGLPLIIIVIAQQQHTSDTMIGLIFSISGIGAIVGALLVRKVQQNLSFAQIIIGCLWLYVAFWLALATQPSALLLGIFTGLLFAIDPFYNVTNISQRMAITPDGLQGRVNSVARLIARGLAPMGLTLTGLLLQYYDPRITVLVAVSGQFILAVLVTFNRNIRNVSTKKTNFSS